MLGSNCNCYPSPAKAEAGADPGFFSGGGALVSCSTSTPINHMVFFCTIPVILENRRSSQRGGGGGGAHPLHPPSRSAPGKCSLSPRFQTSFFVSPHRNFAYVKMPLFWSFQINLIWPFQHRKKKPVVFEFHDFAISLNQRDD